MRTYIISTRFNNRAPTIKEMLDDSDACRVAQDNATRAMSAAVLRREQAEALSIGDPTRRARIIEAALAIRSARYDRAIADAAMGSHTRRMLVRLGHYLRAEVAAMPTGPDRDFVANLMAPLAVAMREAQQPLR